MKLSDNTYRKFVEEVEVNDYEVETDEGFVPFNKILKTVPYKEYCILTKNNLKLMCADKHILFDENFNEIYAEDISMGTLIQTINGCEEVIDIYPTGNEMGMYDLELDLNSNNRYFTNGILSHNTLTGKVLAKEIFGDEKYLVRFDMPEYSDKTAVNKLIGAGSGYVGYDKGGLLTEAVKRHKHCVLLIDEIEKADEEVYNLFLQVLDEGFLTDNTGYKVDFKNTIVIFTSNIGTKEAALSKSIGFNVNLNESSRNIIEKSLKKKFPPEFINRLDKIVYFNQLTDENIKNIIGLELGKLDKRITAAGYSLSYDTDSVIDFLFDKIKDEREYGARPVIRTIQNEIENKLADAIMNGDDKSFKGIVENDEINILRH